jgi:hypothetical protein
MDAWFPVILIGMLKGWWSVWGMPRQLPRATFATLTAVPTESAAGQVAR